MRVIDVASGVYDDHAFVISGVGGTGTLTVIPDAVTFTGNLNTDCGGGTASVAAFDGLPPFSAFASAPQIHLANTTSSTNPGLFTFSVNTSAPPCPTGTIVITDSSGSRGTVAVTSAPGSGTPPTPAAFTVAPTTITLGCGQAGSVSVVGGSGSFSTVSSSPNVTSTVSGSTVTITRANSGTNAANDSTVSVTDGANIGTVTVTSPLTCP